jgi:hypothetical protein
MTEFVRPPSDVAVRPMTVFERVGVMTVTAQVLMLLMVRHSRPHVWGRTCRCR